MKFQVSSFKFQVARLVLACAMALAFSSFARAATDVTSVTVSAQTVSNWRYGGTTAKLRIYASDSFFQTGVFVQGGILGSGQWYQEVACTVAANMLSIPAVVLQVTTTSTVQTATYTVVYVDSGGTERESFQDNLPVPSTFGATVTWQQLASYRDGAPRPRTAAIPTTDQVASMISAGTFARTTINPVPTYDLASGGLAVGQIISTPNILTVLDNKVLDHIRISQSDGSTSKFSMLAAGVPGGNPTITVSGLDFQLEAAATSTGNSALYGVIGQLVNKGPVSTKAIYGRVTMDAASTGVGVAGVFAVSAQPANNTTWILQLTGTDSLSQAVNISADNGVSANFSNGIVFATNVRVESGGAFFQGFQTAGHTGDFLLYRKQDSTVLFRADQAGNATVASLTSNGATNLLSASNPVLQFTDTGAPGAASSFLGHFDGNGGSTFQTLSINRNPTTGAITQAARAASAVQMIATNLDSSIHLQTNNVNGVAPVDRMVIDKLGNLRLNAYGAGTLVTDVSGNTTAAGAIQWITGTQPTCNSGNRGFVWYVAGGAGVKDTFNLCGKDAADVYSWRVIY